MAPHPAEPVDGVCGGPGGTEGSLGTLRAAVLHSAWLGVVVEAPFMHPHLIHLQQSEYPQISCPGRAWTNSVAEAVTAIECKGVDACQCLLNWALCMRLSCDSALRSAHNPHALCVPSSAWVEAPVECLAISATARSCMRSLHPRHTLALGGRVPGGRCGPPWDSGSNETGAALRLRTFSASSPESSMRSFKGGFLLMASAAVG